MGQENWRIAPVAGVVILLCSVLAAFAPVRAQSADRSIQGVPQANGEARGAGQVHGLLEADYTITAASVPVGRAAWTARLTGDHYVSQAVGRGGSAISFFFSGEAAFESRGILRQGAPHPEEFSAKIAGDDDKAKIEMGLTDGNVTALSVVPPDTTDHVPVTASQLQRVIDPLSALLIGGPGAGPLGARESCQRTLPIFDGRRRYDLVLSFKRLDHVRTAIGYRGSVAVCAVRLRAISGHRADSALVAYATDGRAIELWLAPLGAMHMRAPVRFSIASMLGNLVIAADRFAFRAQSMTR